MNRLKAAEKEASKIVADARNYRVEKMKEAKTGAEDAIATYGKDLDDEHKAAAASRQNAEGGGDANLDATTDKDIMALGRDFSAGKDDVSKLLVDIVCATAN